MEKAAKAINGLTIICEAALLLFAVLLVLPRLLGLQLFVILSGSMEPSYPVGSLIMVEPTAFQDVTPGDAITFRLSDGTVVTHRTIAVEPEGICTKGDRNEIADAVPVSASQLIGTPRHVIPRLGYLVHFIQRPPGLFLIIAAGMALILLNAALDAAVKRRRGASGPEEKNHQRGNNDR